MELSKRSLEACVPEIDTWMLLNRLKLSKDKTELFFISVHVLHLPCHIFMTVMRECWLRRKQVTLEFFLTNPWVLFLGWLQFANRHSIISVKLASFVNISPLMQPSFLFMPSLHQNLTNVTRYYLGHLITRLNISNVYRMQQLVLLLFRYSSSIYSCSFESSLASD